MDGALVVLYLFCGPVSNKRSDPNGPETLLVRCSNAARIEMKTHVLEVVRKGNNGRVSCSGGGWIQEARGKQRATDYKRALIQKSALSMSHFHC